MPYSEEFAIWPQKKYTNDGDVFLIGLKLVDIEFGALSSLAVPPPEIDIFVRPQLLS